jgi:predicted nucleic-acid-binding Zn-ribbon protein
MHILITTKWTNMEGVDAKINCPKCGAMGASARMKGTEEKNSLFFLIPLFMTRYTTLTCKDCGASFRLFKSLDEILDLSPEAIAQLIEKRVPFLIKFCIVSSIAFFIIPFLGLIFGGIGFAATAKKQSGWRRAAIVGLALSLLPVIAIIIGLMIGK